MHLLGIDDLPAERIREILDHAKRMDANPRAFAHRQEGQILCTAFFEPSTRTRLSFEAAGQRLGMGVIGFSDAASTSSQKGETLEDTIRILGGYADAIVLRHPERGAAKRAASVSDVPIINAGDGDGEHPSQTLLDLYTIWRNHGRLDGLKVALVGDLRYGRTVHSLAPALQRLGSSIMAVPAGDLNLPAGFDVPVLSLEEAAHEADVLYVTRVQKERFLDPKHYEAIKDAFLVDRDLLTRTQSRASILHPLPRVGEVATDVDVLPAAKYFEQARNGLPVRMAILDSLLGEDNA